MICNGLPEKNGVINETESFKFNSSRENDCVFLPYNSKLNNNVLRIYSQPPCETSYFCPKSSAEYPIYCKADGTFDRKASCISKSVSLDRLKFSFLEICFLELNMSVCHLKDSFEQSPIPLMMSQNNERMVKFRRKTEY